MKAFIIGFLFGVIVGGGALWYVAVGKDTPTVQQAEERAATQAEKVKQSLAAKFEVLELRPEDIRQELAEQGQVLRRKARDIGEAVKDATLDARTTATIKTKLAADPDFSVLDISVTTTDGQVRLSGTTSSPELISKAMTLALETEGVREVIATIQVAPLCDRERIRVSGRGPGTRSTIADK